MKFKITVLYLLTLAFLQSNAQQIQENYIKASELPVKIKDKVYYTPVNAVWIDNSHEFWYLNPVPQGKEFVLVNAETLKKTQAFDHQKLADAFSKISGVKTDPYHLPFDNFQYGNNKQKIEFLSSGNRWSVQLKDMKIEDLGPVPPRPTPEYWNNRRDDSKGQPVFSPDSSKVAFLKDNNVYYYNTDDPKTTVQLSFDGSFDNYYSAYISWSPDSKKLVSYKTQKTGIRQIYFVESSPSDQLQPKLQTRNYPKPGDAISQKQPIIFNLENQTALQVDPQLISNQYSLSFPKWQEDSQAIWFEYNQRGHQNYIVFKTDAITGETTKIIHEISPTFIDYSGKRFRYDLKGSKEIIWASERDGWNHLYLYDAETGKIKNQITKGNWVVRKVVFVNEDERTILFEASGKENGQDPYLIQYYKINFDGSGLKTLTTENANHRAFFSKDYKYFVDIYSRIDSAPITVLRESSSGKILKNLESSDISDLLKTGWRTPEVFSTKGRDGETDIWGIIIRPTHFDPSKTYPIIENIYAGPQGSFVPKDFVTNAIGMAELAELGFIVVKVDGMGTSNRSKRFHDVAWKNLKDAGFADRMAWMKAAAQKYPEMDIERVGVYGNSAGGQNAAAAVLFHPEFYKVAVASSGCHDNRIDKMWWNEQWMGYPIGPEYAECSNTENAHLLGGKLLLIVGELDDNVDPASTYQFVNALIKANKDHDFIMIPGMGHSYGGQYGEQKRRDFFVKHLLNSEPPKWNN